MLVSMLWTPLILFCYVEGPIDCAIPVAPAYLSESDCLDALHSAIETFALPEGMVIVGSMCYNWGAGL